MATGQCNCGSVQVTVQDGLPQESLLCHCLSCRASCGSIFSVNLVVKTASLSITGEEHIKQYSATAESGNTAVRKFCGNCGSPIMTVVAGQEESAFLKGGLFPSGSLPPPKQELFTKRAEEWEKPINGAQWA